MSKYSRKTAISLYEFESETVYRDWLSSKMPKNDCQDIIAIVKNEDMNYGYDLFMNGHSLTKTKIYIKKGDSVVEVTDKSKPFDATKQYSVIDISRRGVGQKTIVVLEELDFGNIVDQKIKDFSDNELNDYLEDYLEDYFETHPIQNATADTKKFEKILTNTHYMFRKIFSLLYHERAVHLGLETTYFNENDEKIIPFTNYANSVSVKKLQFRVSGALGKDVTFKAFKLYKNDENVPFFSIGGENIVNGLNPSIPVDFQITEDTTIHAILEYTMNRLVDTARTNNILNFDKIVQFKTKDEKTCCCNKFYILKPEFVLPTNLLVFDDKASQQSITVSSNSAWSIQNNTSWLSINPRNGNGSGTITFSVSANPDIIDRETDVIFVVDGGETKTLKIRQDKVDSVLSISPSSLTFTNEKSTKSLTVASNYAWSVKDNASWINLESVSDTTVNVTVEENETTGNRSGVIIFESEGNTKTVSVLQQGREMPKVMDKCYIFFVPTEYDSDGYTKLKTPFDSIQNLETVGWFSNTSRDYSEIENVSFQFEYNKTANHEFTFMVPNQFENYQLYIMVPARDLNIPSDLNDANSPIKLSASNFDDSITEKCDVGTETGLDYILFKQSFAQGANQSFVLKLSTK